MPFEPHLDEVLDEDQKRRIAYFRSLGFSAFKLGHNTLHNAAKLLESCHQFNASNEAAVLDCEKERGLEFGADRRAV